MLTRLRRRTIGGLWLLAGRALATESVLERLDGSRNERAVRRLVARWAAMAQQQVDIDETRALVQMLSVLDRVTACALIDACPGIAPTLVGNTRLEPDSLKAALAAALESFPDLLTAIPHDVEELIEKMVEAIRRLSLPVASPVGKRALALLSEREPSLFSSPGLRQRLVPRLALAFTDLPAARLEEILYAYIPGEPDHDLDGPRGILRDVACHPSVTPKIWCRAVHGLIQSDSDWAAAKGDPEEMRALLATLPPLPEGWDAVIAVAPVSFYTFPPDSLWRVMAALDPRMGKVLLEGAPPSLRDSLAGAELQAGFSLAGPPNLRVEQDPSTGGPRVVVAEEFYRTGTPANPARPLPPQTRLSAQAGERSRAPSPKKRAVRPAFSLLGQKATDPETRDAEISKDATTILQLLEGLLKLVGKLGPKGPYVSGIDTLRRRYILRRVDDRWRATLPSMSYEPNGCIYKGPRALPTVLPLFAWTRDEQHWQEEVLHQIGEACGLLERLARRPSPQLHLAAYRLVSDIGPALLLLGASRRKKNPIDAGNLIMCAEVLRDVGLGGIGGFLESWNPEDRDAALTAMGV